MKLFERKIIPTKISDEKITLDEGLDILRKYGVNKECTLNYKEWPYNYPISQKETIQTAIDFLKREYDKGSYWKSQYALEGTYRYFSNGKHELSFQEHHIEKVIGNTTHYGYNCHLTDILFEDDKEQKTEVKK